MHSNGFQVLVLDLYNHLKYILMKSFALIFLLLVIAGCKQIMEVYNDAQEKIDVVHQYTDAVMKQDVATMKKLLADNYLSYGPALKTSVTKSQNISDWERGWKDRIVSMKYKRIHSSVINIEKGKLAGDWVSDWGEVTTIYKDGKSVKFWFNGLYKVEEGMITEARVIYDNMDILTQLGYDFLPPSDFIQEYVN